MRQLLFILLVMLLAGCVERRSDGSPVDPDLLPTSIGRPDELLLVMDANMLQGPVGTKMKEMLRAEYLVLPQSEPMFLVNDKPYHVFSGILQKYRNVVLVAALDEENEMAKMMRTALGSNLEKARTNDAFFYSKRNNAWASPQTVLYLFAPNQQELLNIIDTHHQMITDVLMDAERPAILKNCFITGKSDKATNLIKAKFDIKATIPKDFTIAMEQDNFLWLRRERDESSLSLMIYTEPLDASLNTDENYGVTVRNRLGKSYIQGELEGTYMITDTVIPTYYERTKISTAEGFENRGLWRLKDDFMGGPFLNYYLIDRAKNRVIVLDGFAYAPKLKKKPMIREVEALFNSFEF